MKTAEHHYVYTDGEAAKWYRRVLYFAKDFWIFALVMLIYGGSLGFLLWAVPPLGRFLFIVSCISLGLLFGLDPEVTRGLFGWPARRSLAPVTAKEWKFLKDRAEHHPDVRALLVAALKDGRSIRGRDFDALDALLEWRRKQKRKRLRAEKEAADRLAKQQAEAAAVAEIQHSLQDAHERAKGQTWHVGSVVRTELLSNLEEKRDLIVGFGKYPVLVPTSSTVLRKQTLVVTDQWQFLVDGQWLLAKGTQLEVRERTAGPQLCVKAEQACHRFHQSSQLQVESANSSELPNRSAAEGPGERFDAVNPSGYSTPVRPSVRACDDYPGRIKRKRIHELDPRPWASMPATAAGDVGVLVLVSRLARNVTFALRSECGRGPLAVRSWVLESGLGRILATLVAGRWAVSMKKPPRISAAERAAGNPTASCWCSVLRVVLLLLADDQAAGDGDAGGDFDVEALAVVMRPGGADPRPELAIRALIDHEHAQGLRLALIGGVVLRGVVGLGHDVSPFVDESAVARHQEGGGIKQGVQGRRRRVYGLALRPLPWCCRYATDHPSTETFTPPRPASKDCR
uniref:Uncharacterized protein n=1 Tax=Caenorhabditis japonica TaxID=281687 RepID=A0A8R1IBA8_CAEJA